MRWVCPKCRRAGLAPERPRRDDVRRYCLICSKQTGKLVERVAPVLVKRREKAAALRAESARGFLARETQRWTVAGIDVRDLAHDCWRTLGHVVHEFFALRVLAFGRPWSSTCLPTITLRRRGIASQRSTNGWARGRGHVTLMIGMECTAPDLQALVLHELAHCAHAYLRRSGNHKVDRPHGDTFNRLMVNAAARLWGVTVGIGSPGYGASRALRKALHARHKPEAGAGIMAIVDHFAGLCVEASS